MGEFDLIEQFIGRRARAGHAPQVRVPIGDDCAILSPQTGTETCLSTDMLVQGQHFLADVDPHALGHKALAVNLSDLAAMGAAPRLCMLSLALPQADAAWLQAFMDGFFALADAHDCALIGGDTTRAPLIVINVVAGGVVPTGGGVLRSGARAGQDLWVSGTLGDAALGLAARRGAVQLCAADSAACIKRLERPSPRVRLGLALGGIATSMIDLSDGMAGDLMHILRASGVAAQVDCRALPLSPALRSLPTDAALRYALAGGDDYELLFTADPRQRERLTQLQAQLELPLTRIGQIIAGDPHAHWLRDGVPLEHDFAGFDHFAT